ncbi:MAG: phosphatase PAP2 family protein [Gammaproteobacteria bacterium]
MHSVLSLDAAILAFAAAHRSEILDQLFRGITWLGSLYVLIPTGIALVSLLAHRRNRFEAWLLGIGLCGAALMAHTIKGIVARPRPELYPLLIELPVSDSFPSGHVAQASAFFLCLTIAVRRLAPEWAWWVTCAALVMVACVATSRIYLQVHFPSDTLGGMVLGALWVTVLYKLMLRRERQG